MHYARQIAPVLLLLLLSLQRADAQSDYIRSPRLGITFVASADHPATDARYRNALLLGAGWNRWPLYWNAVERSADSFDWLAYDRLVYEDLRHGLRSNAILLGIPDFRRDGGVMAGLYAPAFADGSDTLGAGKLPNPGSPWARFVFAAVSRYRPGGLLSAQMRWPAGWGVSVWEIWNEPDLQMFWSGSTGDYARLLKVAYLIIKSADANAHVLFGGLAYTIEPGNWLARTLSAIAGDSGRAAYNWYFDWIAIHTYTNPRRSRRAVEHVRAVLAAYGLSRPVWVNESGLSVWDDYPGANWTGGDPGARQLRGTQGQQAAYIIQSTALAWAAGAEVVFVHQLYDDCGNQPSGTDFAPNNNNQCGAALCSGDAYGLYRNERDSACFRQHPQPGSARAAATAYYVLAQVFGSANFSGGQIISLDERATVVAFDLAPGATLDMSVPAQRVYVVWSQGERLPLELPASGTSAIVVNMDNSRYSVVARDGWYELGLPEAIQPFSDPEVAAIGGAPLIVIEGLLPGAPLADPRTARFKGAQTPTPLPTATFTPSPTAVPGTPTMTFTPAPRPTFNPLLTLAPPIAAIYPLPEVSPRVFTVRWTVVNNTEVAGYLIWVQIDGGAWQPWLETTAAEAVYEGEPGRTYAFAAWAVNLAGDWTPNPDLSPQTVTRVE
jgi:hypothetical protein